MCTGNAIILHCQIILKIKLLRSPHLYDPKFTIFFSSIDKLTYRKHADLYQ